MANSKVTQHTVQENDKRFFSQQEQEEIAKHHNVETPNIEHPENDEQYTGLQVNAGIEQMPIGLCGGHPQGKHHGAGAGGDAGREP